MTKRKEEATTRMQKWSSHLHWCTKRMAAKIGEGRAVEKVWEIRILDYDGLHEVYLSVCPEDRAMIEQGSWGSDQA